MIAGERRGRLAVASLLVALVVSTDGIAGGPAPVRAATPSKPGPCVGGWQVLPVPDRALTSTPYEILARAGKPAWALGGTKTGALVLRWKHGRWRRVAVGGSGHRGVVGATTTSRTTVLAAGYDRPSDDRLLPVIARVSASRFSSRRIPDPPGPRASLADIAKLKSGRAWAVGTRLVGGRTRAYAIRDTGRRWVRDEPSSTGKSSGLTAVERSPSGVVWAVGWKEGTIGIPRPLIARRTNGSWRQKGAQGVPDGPAVLVDVAFRAGDDGWAVGYLIENGEPDHRVILLHWDGDTWSRQPLPWADDFAAVPRAIAASPDGDIRIAGAQLATNGREARGFIASHLGGTWSVAVLDVPKGVRSEVLSVKPTKKGAIASGTVVNSALLLRTCSVGAGMASREGRRVPVGDLATRRATDDDPHLEEPDGVDGPASSAGAVDPAASVSIGDVRTVRALPAAVAPKGFRVRDVARSKGLNRTISTWSGFAAEMNGDGRVDLFISRHKRHRPLLLINRKKGFRLGRQEPYRLVDRHGCDAADIDRDGARDILCVVGRGRGRQINRHELSLRPGHPDGKLVRGARGISDPFGRGRKVAFLRLDDDPWPDVFIANQPDRDDALRARNRFFRNEGGTFAPAPGVGLDRAVGGDCLHASDVDGDGDDDLLHCVVFPDDGRGAGLRLYRNENGTLRDRSKSLRIRPMRDIDVELVDVTGDGRRDLIQLSRTRLRVSKGTKSGFRRIYERRTSDAVAIATGDASGDGRPDIYLLRGGRGNKPDALLVNRRRGRGWRSVRIPQTSRGRADDVIAIDHDLNGHTDFVVLNGFNTAGPVQLIASFPKK